MAGIKAFRSFECLTGRRVARPQLAGIGPTMNFRNRPEADHQCTPVQMASSKLERTSKHPS